MVSQWTEVFLATSRKHIAVNYITIRPSGAHWLSAQIKQIICKHNRLQRKAKAINNLHYWLKYRKATSRIVKDLRKSKEKYETSLAEKFQPSDSNDTRLW